jgi:hypothetical protein
MQDPSTPENASAAMASPGGRQQTPAAATQGSATPDNGAPAYEPPVYPTYGLSFNPTETAPRSIVKRALIVAAAGAGALLMLAILAAVAIPTFLSVKAASSGTAWFNGGVAGWPSVNATDLNFSDGKVVGTWKVQGASFRGPGPYMAVIRTSGQLPSGETARQYFSAVAQQLQSDGDDADLTSLSNGSPAVEWTKPVGFGAGSSDYYLYANDGPSLYMVYLEASAQDFLKALDIAKPVMFNFKGTR